MKNRITLFLLISLLLGCNNDADVFRFIEKREQCDHFREEISGNSDIDNARDLNVELDRYCKGIDKELMQLKNKYKTNLTIIKKLDGYEENIEPK